MAKLFEITKDMVVALDKKQKELDIIDRNELETIYSECTSVSEIMARTYTKHTATYKANKDTGNPEMIVTEKECYFDLVTVVTRYDNNNTAEIKKVIEAIGNYLASYTAENITNTKTAPSISLVTKALKSIEKVVTLPNGSTFISIDSKYLMTISTRKGKKHGEIVTACKKGINDLIYCKLNGIGYTVTNKDSRKK